MTEDENVHASCRCLEVQLPF